MPFAKKTVMEQRSEFVQMAIRPHANVSQLCKRYGISRKVGYKWLNRYRAGGQKALQDQDKRPHTSPGQTEKGVEDRILTLRKKNPEWGARKLKIILERDSSLLVPSASTIGLILKRNGLIKEERSIQQTPMQRFEYDNPNELWQMDFKGGFKLLDNANCHPLTITDDHSRFNLCLAACTNQQSLTVRERLIAVFRKYGLPDRILTDNGTPWGTTGNSTIDGDYSFSALEVWLLRLSVNVIHGRPYHPQTQGKEERFHRTLKTELLQYEQFRNIEHCQQRFDRWRDKYNLERPHQAIGFKTPAQKYAHSLKTFPEVLPQINYLTSDATRKVDSFGFISFKGCALKAGKGFVGQWVALRETNTENLYELYFCNQKIKDIFVMK